jgi:hypothetical protein
MPAAQAAMAVADPVYQQLLQCFPDVLSPAKELLPVKPSVVHFIETDGRPVAAKYCRLNPVKLQAARKEFAELERQGIIHRSSSDWYSPLHMLHPCSDFYQLNLQTKPDCSICWLYGFL